MVAPAVLEPPVPPAETGFAEAAVVIFTEFRKRVGEDEFAVAHVTVRSNNDAEAFARLLDFERNFHNLGFEWANEPKPKFNKFGGSGGNKSTPKAPFPVDGRLPIAMIERRLTGDRTKSYAIFHSADGNTCRAWGKAISDSNLFPASWVNLPEKVPTDIATVLNLGGKRLIAICNLEKGKPNPNNPGSNYPDTWMVQGFEIE